MSHRIGAHLRSNIVGYVAIFMFAMGGTAYAIHPGGDNTIDSGDIINQQVLQPDIAAEAVGTDQIKNNQVRSPDIKTGEVQTSDVLDNTLTQADIGTQSVGSDELTGTGFGNNGFNGDQEIIDGTITGFDIAANQIGGGHVADGSLSGADIADDTLTNADVLGGASASATGGGCNDDDANGEVCVTLNITLNQTSKVMATATGGWHTHGTSGGMNCLIDHDGFETIGAVQNIGEVGANHPLGTSDGTMALTGISAPIGPGTHAISLICTQVDADADVTNSSLAVATVDG